MGRVHPNGHGNNVQSGCVCAEIVWGNIAVFLALCNKLRLECHCMGTVTIIAVTIHSRWRTAISVCSNYADFWAICWEIAPLSCVLYGCVNVLRNGLGISNDVAHLTARRLYFDLSTMIVTDSPGTRQMIVTAL